MSGIVGLDLNIDHNFLADAVRQTVIMGISESLNGKNEIVSQLVKMVLETKVSVKDGNLPKYSSDKTCTILEFYVRKAIEEVTKEELQTIIDERKPEITDVIRKELQKKVNYTKFVDAFISNVHDSISSSWCPRIEVNFENRKEY